MDRGDIFKIAMRKEAFAKGFQDGARSEGTSNGVKAIVEFARADYMAGYNAAQLARSTAQAEHNRKLNEG